MSDIYKTLSHHGFKKCEVKCLAEKYGEENIITLLKGCPYKLALDGTVDFRAIDRYVMDSTKVYPLCPARLAAALQYTLLSCERGIASPEDAEEGFEAMVARAAGSTCILKSEAYDYLEALLGLEEGTITLPILDKCIKHLSLLQKLSINRLGGRVYLATKHSFLAESRAAKCVCAKLGANVSRKNLRPLYRAIDSAMASTGKILSQEQKDAVVTILQSRFSVLTGGPGTGKTQTELVLIRTLKNLDPNATVRCIAPTGQAARRMTQATGYPATTVHKALGMVPGLQNTEKALLTESLIICDEASMLDTSLFCDLMENISERSSIVLVGDVAQLPSVGAGTVLSELIKAESVPVARLTKIFRQGDNSIAFNCARIQASNPMLDFDDSFEFITRSTSEEIRDEVVRLYAEEVRKNGIDSVCCLTPYRRSTETGVNSLNRAIRTALYDTAALSYCENKNGIRIYTGDKITFLRNRFGLVNGEIGTAVMCSKDTAVCRFGDKEITLRGDDLSFIDPAFSQTVHKAQGMEYPTCIIVLDELHTNMLTKEVVYTAISRAKLNVVLVGQPELLKKAVLSSEAEDAKIRKSCLALLIEKEVQKHGKFTASA